MVRSPASAEVLALERVFAVIIWESKDVREQTQPQQPGVALLLERMAAATAVGRLEMCVRDRARERACAGKLARMRC